MTLFERMLKERGDHMLERTAELCRIPSPSGYTDVIIGEIERELLSLGYHPQRINKGGLTCDVGGSAGTGGTLVVSAHVDTVGAMVNFILGNGHLHLAMIGGVVFANLDSENCVVRTRDGREYTGTLQLDEPSTHANGEVRTRVRDMWSVEVVLDERVLNDEDVRKLGIRNGDYVFFDARPVITPTGFLKSRHLDDKVQCAVLLEYARWLKDTGKVPARHTVLQFADWEEVGHGGSCGLPADTTAFLAADVGIVGRELSGNVYTLSIVAKDSVAPYHYGMTTELMNAAERAGAPYVVEVFPERYSSDAMAAIRAGYDVRTALFGPGVEATHGYERTHKDAVAATFATLIEFIGTV